MIHTASDGCSDKVQAVLQTVPCHLQWFTPSHGDEGVIRITQVIRWPPFTCYHPQHYKQRRTCMPICCIILMIVYSILSILVGWRPNSLMSHICSVHYWILLFQKQCKNYFNNVLIPLKLPMEYHIAWRLAVHIPYSLNPLEYVWNSPLSNIYLQTSICFVSKLCRSIVILYYCYITSDNLGHLKKVINS